MATTTRRKVLITGAAGGMGRACARLFGATADLILTDVAAPAFDAFVEELEREGYTIAGAHPGDLADAQLLAALVGHLSATEAFTLIHTAGLSPSLADWRRIMAVNLVATELLLQAVEPRLAPGSVAVLIASTAGHSASMMPDASMILAEPLAPDFMGRIGVMIEAVASRGGPGGAGGISYAYSKQAVIALADRRAPAWGARGARIVSLSPGLILTPMGRLELEKTPGAAMVADAAPVGRAGTAMDIALAAQFLASDAASYITGIDLRVDGGSWAAMKQAMSKAQPA